MTLAVRAVSVPYEYNQKNGTLERRKRKKQHHCFRSKSLQLQLFKVIIY